jgi:hypothetical protein
MKDYLKTFIVHLQKFGSTSDHIASRYEAPANPSQITEAHHRSVSKHNTASSKKHIVVCMSENDAQSTVP